LTTGDAGHTCVVEVYATGSARPDRWSRGRPAAAGIRWHAVEAHRPAAELDGEVELALCGAIVQVDPSRSWEDDGAGPAGCASCRRLSGLALTIALGRAG
jgi:hypothetical protein